MTDDGSVDNNKNYLNVNINNFKSKLLNKGSDKYSLNNFFNKIFF